jgi:hypothetical protein
MRTTLSPGSPPQPHDGQRGVPGLINKPGGGVVLNSATAFNFNSGGIKMESLDSEETEDDDHQRRAVDLHVAAQSLDVYRHERLAYTEIPARRSVPRPLARRISARLKTLRQWILSQL